MTVIAKLLTTPIKFPKAMPSNWVLKQIAFPPLKEHFKNSEINGEIRAPKISYRDQWRIRLACRAADIPEESVGLPPLPAAELKRHYTIKGSQRPVEQDKRAAKIQENMAHMTKRIATWKADKKKAKLASIPDMPF
jgi:hypothetical protein